MHPPSYHALAAVLSAVVLCLVSVGAVAAQAGGATSPAEAVRALVRPLAGAESPGGCNTLTGQVGDCPVTARLRTRLQNPQPGVETGNLVSRSQNPPRAVEVAEVKLPADATVAQVNTRWEYGTSAQRFEYTITFVVRQEAGGWLVDDTYCLNDPGTSIFNPPTGPCALSVTNPVPGMPTTGAGQDRSLSGLLLLGIGLVTLGLVAVRCSPRQPRTTPRR